MRNLSPDISDLVFLSEKRKNVLLLLLKGPKDMEEIKKALDMSYVAIQPQIKKLRDNNLVVQDKCKFRLSSVGVLVAKKVSDSVDTFHVLEKNFKYWITRDLSSIPPHILDRIGELGDCDVIEPDMNHVLEPSKVLTDNIVKSKHVAAFFSYFSPIIPNTYFETANKGTQISIIMTSLVFKRILTDFHSELKHFLSLENTNLSVYDGNIALTCTITDWLFGLVLLDEDGVFTHRTLVTLNPQGLEWGKDLFLHYKGLSRQIKEIE